MNRSTSCTVQSTDPNWLLEMVHHRCRSLPTVAIAPSKIVRRRSPSFCHHDDTPSHFFFHDECRSMSMIIIVFNVIINIVVLVVVVIRASDRKFVFLLSGTCLVLQVHEAAEFLPPRMFVTREGKSTQMEVIDSTKEHFFVATNFCSKRP